MALQQTTESPRFVGLSIVKDMDTGNIKSALFGFPAKIRLAKSAVNSAREALNTAVQNRAEAEAELVLDVSTATDPNTGKPKFTNAEARAAALVTAKKVSPDYIQAQSLVSSAERNLTATTDMYEEIVNSQGNFRIVGRMVAGELEVIGNLGTEVEGFGEAKAQGSREHKEGQAF